MRIFVHLTALAALAALSVATGRWLREPNLGGLVLLMLMIVIAAVSLRRLYGARSEPAKPPPPPPRGRPRPDLERVAATPAPVASPEPPLWADEVREDVPDGRREDRD